MWTNFPTSSFFSYALKTFVKNRKIIGFRSFKCTLRYIDHVLSINDPHFSDRVQLMYPPELNIEETTDIASTIAVNDLYLEFYINGNLNNITYENETGFF